MSSAERRFPITAAQLVGNFCETLLYGMYLVTCGLCARAFLFTGSGKEERWLRPHEIRWMMVFIATTLLAICSFDVAIGLLHNFQAFIQSTDPSEEYYDIGDWINISRVSRSLFPAAATANATNHRTVRKPSYCDDPGRFCFGTISKMSSPKSY